MSYLEIIKKNLNKSEEKKEETETKDTEVEEKKELFRCFS